MTKPCQLPDWMKIPPTIYSRKKGKYLPIVALPAAESNLYLNVSRRHLQIIHWKAADQQGPPKVDITKFGWELKGSIPSPCVDTAAPQGSIDVIHFGCKSEGKSCRT